jgi:hypothetical protein
MAGLPQQARRQSKLQFTSADARVKLEGLPSVRVTRATSCTFSTGRAALENHPAGDLQLYELTTGQDRRVGHDELSTLLAKPPGAVFVAWASNALLEHGVVKERHMAVDDVANLRRLREILRGRRRKLVAAMVGGKKEPTKFAPLVELQEACDAVEWALEDEAAAAKKDERR